MTTACAVKTCVRCSEEKPAGDFTKDKSRKDGLNPYCRECTRKGNRKSYVKNFATEKARKAQSYRDDPEKFLSRNRKWRAVNRDRERVTNRAYYARNREMVREWHKAYHQANPHVARACSSRRRALRIRQTIVEASTDQIMQRMAYFGNKCWMCGGPFEHVDHVKPLSKGGPHMLANLRPACAPCNLSKKDKWPVSTRVFGGR